ncbi:unnamed protein product [Arctia plantaginis]|uniref:Active regulator of SIRT1 n=1 Tax=Arctia plantaginis TaxID=874455 RepID=A0A8S0ZZ03_ARCPL|nr:unnamed protein product [Arctia plantaginis]
MSLALVRQALELVDPEECLTKKRGGRVRRPAGQGYRHLSKNKSKAGKVSKSKDQIAEENIKKLLALSKPTADTSTTEKIVERAIKQKPLADKPEVKVDDNKSILFPEGTESFEDFEEELFCS